MFLNQIFKKDFLPISKFQLYILNKAGKDISPRSFCTSFIKLLFRFVWILQYLHLKYSLCKGEKRYLISCFNLD